MKLSVAILFLIFCSFPLFAECEQSEMRVLDARGLTRAVKHLEDPVASIAILFTGKRVAGQSISIQNLDGVQGALSSTTDNSGKVLFLKVPSGAWQLSNPPKGLTIGSVKIQP